MAIKTVALAGNPNVGKSTVFNALTGMNQHTGNWPGKTVSNATGNFSTEHFDITLIDLPGTYSLNANSYEEEVARDFLCFEEYDAVVIVCDATCLERNLNLCLQISEIADRALVCVNLLDEAKRRKIAVDLDALSEKLGLPVVGVSASKPKTLGELLKKLDGVLLEQSEKRKSLLRYSMLTEQAIGMVEPKLRSMHTKYSTRWLSVRLLAGDGSVAARLKQQCRNKDLKSLNRQVQIAADFLLKNGLDKAAVSEEITTATVKAAEEISRKAVTASSDNQKLDRRLDRILTGKVLGYPIMLGVFALIFWITVNGANYPSEWLSTALFWLGDKLEALFVALNSPRWLVGFCVSGVYRVTAWVVSVMLPPMAIFFPLFTLLEDLGYLPRIAFNLDRPLSLCGSCGKQSLTMCMGLGCNAVGITGCRIIETPRERLLSILTNSFMPCNGRFPTIITLISLFFVGAAGAVSGVLSAVGLVAVLVVSVAMTMLVTLLLSKTLLKGQPSSFALELPPYRKPQIGKILVRSVLDRTVFVLGRAVAVAAPAGGLLWILANVSVGSSSILLHICGWLDPIGQIFGLDGVILTAFILGLPANETVLPIALMAYTGGGVLEEFGSLGGMKLLLEANGWTSVTALCVIIFSVFHWPCSTALMTVKKETGSLKWTVLSAVIPTALGLLLCGLINSVAKLIY